MWRQFLFPLNCANWKKNERKWLGLGPLDKLILHTGFPGKNPD